MTPVIVDAAVALKWFLPEVHADASRRLLTRDIELLAPDLIHAEVASCLRKKLRRGEITDETAYGILSDFRRFPVRTFSTESLLATAWELATRFDTPFFDSLYLALAVNQGCVLVTADRQFYDMHNRDPLTAHLLWVENLP